MVTLLLLLFLLHLLMVSAIGAMFSLATIQLDLYLFSLLDCPFLPSAESPVVSCMGESFQDYFRILKFNISQPSGRL